MVQRSRTGLAAALLCLAVPATAKERGPAKGDAVDAPGTEDPAEGSARAPGHDGSAPPAVEEKTSAVALSAVYTADVWRNVRGGIARGTRYLDNLDVTLTVDAEQAFGWRGATLFAYGLYNNGQPFSETRIGDVQGVSNIETGVRAARLYEAWAEQRFASDRASLKFGLYDLNSEFDAIETAALFLGPSHGIGPDFSQSGRNGPSIFPSTSLALRGEFRIADRWLARAAILDGAPGDADRPKRTTIKLGQADGALTVVELNYGDGDDRAAVGYWRYTRPFEDIRAEPRGGKPAMRGSNDGLYMFVERRLTREETDDPQGLSGWVRLGFADAALNPIGRYVGGGLAYTGPFRGRDEDRAGIAAGWVRFGDPLRRARARAGEPIEAGELIVEATYRAPVTRWLTLQPDVQFVLDPGGGKGIGNALIFGLRAEVGF